MQSLDLERQTVMLDGKGDFGEWREAARRLLMVGTWPAAVDWREKHGATDLFADPPPARPNAEGKPEGTRPEITVPRAFMTLAETVICHSDPGRFTLLYRTLWRLQAERNLLDIVSDADVVRLNAMEKSVRRDSHKMKAFVRFKEIGASTSTTSTSTTDIMEVIARPAPLEASGIPIGRRRFFAWFEPDHFIVARAAPFFQRRFTDMDWIIATPKGSAAWDGTALTVTSEPADDPKLTDDADTLWRTYYSNIFNPARLKVKAMQSEMPKKYWKNLPEANLIPGLIAGAEEKVRAMAEQAMKDPPAFHAKVREAAMPKTEENTALPGTLEAARAEARDCTRCPLSCKATQTVFGEGPDDAKLMFVGEQPGDQEDLAGRPFIGPAGKMFDTIAGEVDLDRKHAYVTNAVKHFKYEPRGKRRIHQKPNMGEIRACRWWLKLELDLIQPKLVVAMGATALTSVMNHAERLSDYRSRTVDLDDGRALYTTVHPSYLLRIPDEGRKREEIDRFREDLQAIKSLSDTL
ncbi:UdgX family uracil-DNA binding protein [Rhizobiaceae bacterium CRRU44]|uniref:Type-4 uracil-DNA glycosylase n=2 Tax=Ferranicluibacter rubi TaxID=2715133 RepID=A0AA43ZFW6_9HYPH|nr:UdgX family uracil-DNA binding protein [Ferranicluibacter rubi]